MKDTQKELLDTISVASNIYKDLGISAEMYYNYNTSGSCSSSCSDSTLQQSTGPTDPAYVNVTAPEALSSSSSPSGTDVEKSSNTTKPVVGNKVKNTPKKISTEHYYTQINLSVNEIRRGKRTDRMTAYISMKDENDKKFTIFLRSSLTTANDETLRSLRKNNNKILEDILLEMMSECPSNAKFFSGRLRYNPRRFKIEDEHKTNLKSALIGIYDYGTEMTCILYVLGEFFVIQLTDDLTTKQNGLFDYTGCYMADIKEED